MRTQNITSGCSRSRAKTRAPAEPRRLAFQEESVHELDHLDRPRCRGLRAVQTIPSFTQRFQCSQQCSAGRALPIMSPLAQMVSEVLRAGGFPNASDKMVARQFNRHHRFVQLNVIALALSHAGVNPEVSGEMWHSISNPFRLEADEKNIEAVSDRIHAQHGVRLSVSTAPLRFNGDRIES